MMKLVQKTIVTVIALMICISYLPVNAYADRNEGQYTTPLTITVNEYDMTVQLANKSVTTLRSKGYSNSEIRAIKNYKETYEKHVMRLKILDDNTLIANGYNMEQIKTIRSFTGSDAEMRAISASLTLSASTNSFNYDGNYTCGTLTYSWNWTSVPAFKLKDMVAVSWNSWVVTSNSSNVKYYNINTGAYYTQESATFTQDGNGVLGAAHKFNVSKSDNYYYAKKGSGSFTVRSDVHAAKDFIYYIAYGHSQLVASISFSASAPGGVSGSITFSIGTVIMDSKQETVIV